MIIEENNYKDKSNQLQGKVLTGAAKVREKRLL
jgi:hypothetical protein